MRLNQYIAQSGFGTRRQAGELVKKGQVKVNGQVETNPAYLVQPDDKILLKEKSVSPQEKKVYFLFNKPKNVSTTLTKKKGDRKTVAELVRNKVPKGVSPIERMESASTGLLILTNDQELVERLTHSNHQVKIVYQATLENEIEEAAFEKILQAAEKKEGLMLKSISYLENKPKNEIGIDLRQGSDKSLRNLLEKQGLAVQRLDRVTYGGLTKKDLPRGFVRPLKDKEVIWLKHFL
jgi:23S rRNA pseudouridine2605 synthase